MDVEENGPKKHAKTPKETFVLDQKDGVVMQEQLISTKIVMATVSWIQFVLTPMVTWESSKALKNVNLNGHMQYAELKEQHAFLAEDTKVGAVMLNLFTS